MKDSCVRFVASWCVLAAAMLFGATAFAQP